MYSDRDQIMLNDLKDVLSSHSRSEIPREHEALYSGGKTGQATALEKLGPPGEKLRGEVR